MSDHLSDTNQLTDLQVGPVLRGIDAAAGIVVRMSGAAESGMITSCGPGALYTLEQADRPEAAETTGAGHGDEDSILTLTEPLTVESIARQWNEFVDGGPNHSGGPRHVILPSGARWVLSRPGPGRPVPAPPIPGYPQSTRDLTPQHLAGALTGRVAIVTGAAQGFGWEIARGLAAIGAVVALADINLNGVQERAGELGGPHNAFSVNVTDEESVAAVIRDVTARFGGVDLVVSNAGVLKAGSVKALSLKDFRFVTDVNYIGFFLMTKHCSPVMELQDAAAQYAGARYPTDIVEINSKSGLEGSNKNAAYAGSKFGGIGLVQSFALELVEQGTKVNAVCPGNFLDGPLWSDPENGLFVQYLRAGKVPGAKTLDDVRRFYEGKVPMNRGCTGSDVVRAIAYVVSQEYETGQAVPVTGGQVMLS